jgi:hypothetical protein
MLLKVHFVTTLQWFAQLASQWLTQLLAPCMYCLQAQARQQPSLPLAFSSIRAFNTPGHQWAS